MTMIAPNSMNEAIGRVLRYGVVLSAAIVVVGLILLVGASGFDDVSSSLVYNPAQVPHGNFDVSLSGLLSGLLSLNPYSVIELGVIVLIATPVSRVLSSVVIFAAEGDRQYVYITAVVLVILLFSILVTPLIPAFLA